MGGPRGLLRGRALGSGGRRPGAAPRAPRLHADPRGSSLRRRFERRPHGRGPGGQPRGARPPRANALGPHARGALSRGRSRLAPAGGSVFRRAAAQTGSKHRSQPRQKREAVAPGTAVIPTRRAACGRASPDRRGRGTLAAPQTLPGAPFTVALPWPPVRGHLQPAPPPSSRSTGWHFPEHAPRAAPRRTRARPRGLGLALSRPRWVGRFYVARRLFVA